MIAGIVGLAGALLNDKPFRIPRTAANFRIHVIFTIAAARQPALAVLKIPPPDISGERNSFAFLQAFEEVLRFQRRR
jgi:hypothetical protein